MHMTEQEQPSHCTQQWVKELLNAAPEPSYLGPFEARLQSFVMHPHIRTYVPRLLNTGRVLYLHQARQAGRI